MKWFNSSHYPEGPCVHLYESTVLGTTDFVFFNRLKQRCKILYWDRDGLVVWAKRLERGRFQIPSGREGELMVQVDGTTLVMILGGVDLKSVQRRKRYQVPSTPCTTDHSAKDNVPCMARCA